MSIGLTWMLLTGCSQAPTTAKQNIDPLHGHLTPPGQPQFPKPANTSASQPATGVSALPTSYSATNNATLAGTSWQGPLGRPLAIDDEGRTYAPGQMGPKPAPTSGFPAPNPNPRVEPVPDAFAAPQNLAPISDWKAPQINKPAESVPALTEEGLFKQLQSRGVLQQKRDAVAEGVRLTCYVPRGPTGGLRALEATAADYPTAAQAILQQLEGSR